MLQRSGHSSGGIGSCLFVPEGPAIFIPSRFPFPEPVCLGLFLMQNGVNFNLANKFSRMRVVITESVLRCDSIPELRAALYVAPFYQHEELQMSCILMGNSNIKRWRKRLAVVLKRIKFLFFSLLKMRCYVKPK